MKNKKKRYFCVAGIAVLCILSGSACRNDKAENQSSVDVIEKGESTQVADQGSNSGASTEKNTETAYKKGGYSDTKEERVSYVHADGSSLKERIGVPEGYNRGKAKKQSFRAFMENYPMCKDGQPVLLYDGTKKGNQDAHVAVFDMDLTDGDLQQCADSVIRMYAEYFYKTKQYDKMQFHFVNGFACSFEQWRKGMRVRVSGNETTWYQGAAADSSKKSMESYLRVVFSYASTLSMEQESKPIKSSDIQAGDIFIKGGSPGHVVMVVDVCENESGQKAFLLAQGYMPAQQFHVLKNPLHEEDPWYYENELEYPLETPEYTFEKGSLMRPQYQS